MANKQQNNTPKNLVQEPPQLYGFRHISEEDRLREDVFRPGIEKLQLFTRMLRKNAMLSRAKIIHSK